MNFLLHVVFLFSIACLIKIIWLLFKRLFVDTSSPASSSRHVNSEEALTSTRRREKYDVFINHRGPDVKDTIASHIYDILDLRGVPAFLDKEELEGGDDFPEAIREAIASSTVHIAIFSPRYAESSWCLRELALMVTTAGATIIPVFFNVTPEEIRWVKKGIFANAFKKLYKRYPPQIVDEWKAALNHVSNISGLPFSEFKGGLARKVVDQVMKKVSGTQTLSVAESPIGLEKHVNKLKEYIFQSRMAEKKVICVGIVGMGGIGKSTLAQALYNSICSNFSRSSYIEDVKGQVEKNGLKHIQQMLLRQLLRYDFEIFNTSQGEQLLREKLTCADALIVYDNIEYNYQMDPILFENVLNPGSTVIVTTRDQSIFRRWNSYLKYELSALNIFQSKELFCRHAFHSDGPSAPFETLVDQFVNVCKGLPLALKVCGGHLYNQSYDNWKFFLNRVSQKTLPELQSILRASYEQLDEKQKEIFLDIAIFFHGQNCQVITRIWEEEAEDFSYDLGILERKCMIKLDYNMVGMHGLFRELGREIVDEESPKYPGRRSRLWRPSDVKEVLRNFTGTESVRGLSLVSGGTVLWDEDEFGNRCAWTTDSFANMKELQLLELKDDCLNGNFGKLSQKLLFLRWRSFPYDSVPVDLQMKQTRILELVGGKLVSLWNDQCQLPLNLRELNMNNCHFLNRVPESMGKLTGLQKVDFSECMLLETIPEEFCYLEALEILNLSYCRNLKYLPLGIGGMKSLQSLKLSKCIKLKVLPESFGELPQLRWLEMQGCENVQIVEGSFGNISTLRKVNLSDCGKLETMPSSLTRQSSLMDLRLGNSWKTFGTNCRVGLDHGFLLKEIPTTIGNLCGLSSLEISGCPELKEIPTTIGNLSRLSNLEIFGCPKLKKIPATIGNLFSLSNLQIYGCLELKEIPTTIGNLSSLSSLKISRCPELKEMPTTIGNLSTLSSLKISVCPTLNEIPTTIGNLSSLANLQIYGCTEMKKIPTTIGNLSSLVNLQIYGCLQLKEIPTTIGNLSSLADLQISRCPELKEIPTTIGNLSSLLRLKISGCLELKEIPTTIGDLSSLLSLKISGCLELKEIPTTIGDLSSLLRLRISRCPELKEIPTTIGNLFGLEESILASIHKLSNLKRLVLSGLPLLEVLPPSFFRNFSRLIDFELTYCPRVKEVTLGHLKDLQRLNLSGCSSLQYISGVSNSTNLSYLNLHDCHNLSNDTILGLHQMKQLNILKVHVSEAFFLQKHLLVENLSAINHVHFTASAIPYINAIIKPSYGEATSPKSTCQELRIESPPTSETCIAIIICFVSVLLIDKFDRQFLPPQATFAVHLYENDQEVFGRMYAQNFEQSKIGELINFIIFKSNKSDRYSSIKVSALTRGSQSSARVYLKQGWMQRIKEGEEEMIQHICSSFFKDLRLQRLLFNARERAPSQLNFRNLHALNIANCRIQRLRLLFNTPIQVEEMELVYRSKQLLWGNHKVLEYLDMSIVDTNLSSTIKSMANLYKMEVMISSRGKVVYKDELQEYDKDALVNMHDKISIQVFSILKSRELLENDLRGTREKKERKS